MAKKSAKEIVKENLPDLEVVEKPSAPAAVADSARRTTKPGPSLAELRKKYLGADAEELAEGGADSIPDEEADVEVVQVRPKQTPADPADDPGPRAVIISKKKGILGAQG